MKKSVQIIFLILSQSLNFELYAQNSCNSSYQFSPSTQNNFIGWSKFPEFNLPFKIIYGGHRLDDTQQLPLKHGFSHLAILNPNEVVAAKNIAILWYGVAYLDGKQPWETLRSPWNNDWNAYQKQWKNFIGNGINADLLVLDIERMFYSNTEILSLKNNPAIPKELQILDNQSFINRYKTDIQKIYAETFRFAKNNGVSSTVKMGAYADAPLYPSIVSIASNNWQKWTSDPSLLNYINLDFTKNTIGGEFYEQQDLVMPSTYFYYDYPNILAGDYLPYLLFMVEANKAWTSKPVVPFVWLRFDAPDRDYHQKFIKPYMAEAAAIFPLMAGANGLWLWENPALFSKNENVSTYESFIYGLYRLSLFKNIFEGSPSYIMPTPANEYPDKRTPIWRGVANKNQLLVAAHNPYAKSENEVVNLEISYKNWKNTITLKGYETYLCQFDLSILSTENEEKLPHLVVFPNPTNDILYISFSSQENKNSSIEIIDLQGKIIQRENVEISKGKNDKSLKINQLSKGNYILRIENFHSQRFIIE
jgi:hypothetical protein